MGKYQDMDLVLIGPNLSHIWDNADTDKQKYPQTHSIVLQFEKTFLENPLLNKTLLYPIKKMLQQSVRGIEFYGGTRRNAKQCLLKLSQLEGFMRVIEFLKLLNMLAVSKEKRPIANAGYTSERETLECVRMDKVYAFVQQNYNRKRCQNVCF